MKVEFACPSCGVKGAVDPALVGQVVRCKQCKYRFSIPAPGEKEPDVYGFDPTREPTASSAGTEVSEAPAFVRTRGRETDDSERPSKPKRPKAKNRAAHRDGVEFAWKTWLVRLAIVAVIGLVGTALFAPRGMVIAGCALLALGSLMVLIGYCAGAYGAFSEDFLHGVLYLAIPLYTAYYIVTRWDDLWIWFACSTAGVVLVTIGTQMLEWAGISA